MTEEEKKAIEELEEFIKGPCETCKYCEAAYKLNRENIIQLLNLTKKLQKENEELNKNYNFLIDKIILKIDEYDYKFEKAKKQNKNDIADYYWDLIINFEKLLGGDE